MSKRVFFTADTHFGHGNIILYCRRPFMSASDIDEILPIVKEHGSVPGAMKIRLEEATHAMDEEMIRRWNETVEPDDDVWHLGDFCYAKMVEAFIVLKRLNGRKHLIRGNHDPMSTYGARAWAFSKDYTEYRSEKTNLVLFHYPMRSWNGSFGGKAIQLHGHCHGMMDPLPEQCDVGVDCWDFRPVTLAQIKERIGVA